MATTTKTVLITDLRQSTDLRVRIGDGAFDDLRRAHDRLLGDAAIANGGEVVKGSGDGLIVLFDAAHCALDAAVAMQRALDRQNARGQERLGLAIGISAGDVALEADDCHGIPVVEAARLCGEAGAGEVLLADVVRVLAGSRSEVELSPRGALELKGLPAPLVTHVARWEQPGVARVAFPEVLEAGAFPFAGRNEALERMRTVWKRAVAGSTQLLLLSGEPGIGKTRTAGEFARAAHAEGAVVLFGRCDEDLAVPFQPFVEPLLALLRGDDDLVAVQRHQHQGILGRLGDAFVALTGSPPPPESTELDRQRLFDAAAELLAAAAATDPILVVLDDLHWASAPTLGLLRHVLRRAPASALMFVGTYRDTDLDRRHPLAATLADLRRDAVGERIALAGLDAEEVFRFVEQASGQDLDETGRALSAAVSAETGGNPFFVSEVLRDLAESGTITFEGDRWVTTRPVEHLGLPEGVREVVGRRLSRLSDAANRVLAIAAVCGPRFEVAVLERVHDPALEVLEALEAAAAAGLVVEDPSRVGTFGFTHALVRQTLLAELTATRQARVHQSIGQAIEAVHARRIEAFVPDLALHYGAAAALGEWDRAIDYARRVVEQTTDRLAWEESFRWLDRALELDELDPSESSVRRMGLLRTLEVRRFASGDRKGAQAAAFEWAELARTAGDNDAYAMAVGRVARAIPFGGANAEIDGMLERALAGAPAGSITRARVLMAMAGSASVNARGRDTVALAEEALATAGTHDDAELISATWSVLAMALQSGPDAKRQLESSQAAGRATVASPGYDYNALFWRHQHCFALVRLGRLDQHHEAWTELLRRCTEDQWNPMLAAGASQHRALETMVTGPLDDAQAQIDAVLEYSGDEPMFLSGHIAQSTWLQLLQGRYAEAEAMVEPVLEIVPALRESLKLTLASIHAEAGNRDAAAQMIARIENSPIVLLERDWSRSNRLYEMAAVAAALGDAELGAAVAAELTPYDGQLLVAYCTHVPASAAHALGLAALGTGDHKRARAHFEAALAFETRIGAAVLAQRTQRRLEALS